MVRAKGVEPSLPREPDPKSGASTNSATRASEKTLTKTDYFGLSTSSSVPRCATLIA